MLADHNFVAISKANIISKPFKNDDDKHPRQA